MPGWTVELLPGGPLPDEIGVTFYENARAKAEFGHGRSAASGWVAGEDSGLEVDALGGRPGVRSARYAGENASDAANVAKLLRELEGVPPASRTARYVCELVCLGPGGDELRGSGTLGGAIAAAPRGKDGFGYDPVFVPAGESRTVAELGIDWKADHSHRAQAARALAALLRARSHSL